MCTDWKSETHMADRCARVHAARNWLKARDIRCSQIKRHRSQTFGPQRLTALMNAVRAEDHRAGAIEASCLLRPSGSCDDRSSFSPDGRTSCSEKTPQTSGQKSHSPANSQAAPSQKPAGSRSMMVAATRTKPVKKPTAKKRAGAKATKKLERLVSKGLSLSRPKPQCFALCQRARIT